MLWPSHIKATTQTTVASMNSATKPWPTPRLLESIAMLRELGAA